LIIKLKVNESPFIIATPMVLSIIFDLDEYNSAHKAKHVHLEQTISISVLLIMHKLSNNVLHCVSK